MKKEILESAQPTDTIEIDSKLKISAQKRFVAGDIDGNILYEITLDEDRLDALDNMVLVKGGRVFLTDNKKSLYIHSEESLKLLHEICA